MINARVAQADARRSNVPVEPLCTNLIEVEERLLSKRTVEGSIPSSGSYSSHDGGSEHG